MFGVASPSTKADLVDELRSILLKLADPGPEWDLIPESVRDAAFRGLAAKGLRVLTELEEA